MERTATGRFQPGNPGKPKGARHRTTLATEELLDGEAEALTRKAVEMALGGDTTAMRLCLERLAPPRRERPVMFDMPPVETAGDVAHAGRALVSRVAEGEMKPTEAGDVLRRLAKTIEITDLERRIKVLEEGGPR